MIIGYLLVDVSALKNLMIVVCNSLADCQRSTETERKRACVCLSLCVREREGADSACMLVLRCWLVGPYIQVGDGNVDHSYWGPPEAMTAPRPSYNITAEAPGTEPVAEAAAALASGYLVFRDLGTYLRHYITTSPNALTWPSRR